MGRTAGGFKITSKVEFSHDIPTGPEIVTPLQPEDGCAEDVPIPAVIAWNDVTESIDGEPLDIVGYEIIVEKEDHVFDVKLPGSATQVTVPAEFLAANTEYAFEVLAIAEGGNQTITEGCLVTAH